MGSNISKSVESKSLLSCTLFHSMLILLLKSLRDIQERMLQGKQQDLVRILVIVKIQARYVVVLFISSTRYLFNKN